MGFVPPAGISHPKGLRYTAAISNHSTLTLLMDKMAESDSGKRSLSRMQTAVEGPKKSYRITIQPGDHSFETGPVDPEAHHEGQPGSLLDFAMKNGIDIDHACGGFAACSTCHVIVHQGLETCNEISDDEDEMLDEAPGLTMKSRLACQCVPDGSQDVVFEIPSWNRNLAREEH